MLESLENYAAELHSAGFEIWTHPQESTFFHYKNPANDCWGTVEVNHWGEVSQMMPTKPTRDYGSAVVVHTGDFEPLSVSAAELTAQPTNRNPWVPTLPNAKPSGLEKRFTKYEITKTETEK